MRKFNILLVEDNAGDVLLTREALGECNFQCTLSVVQDGIAALAYLFNQAPYESAIRPDLILLDLNLPRKNGREVLQAIKNDSTLCCIPVIILTTSGAEQDINESYRLQANCFVTKSVDFDQFLHVIKKIHEFWFTVAKLPSG